MIPRPRATPIQASPPRAENPSPAPAEQGEILGVNELMLSSLPPMMSGADVYMRQFYRDGKLPSRRYLPLPAQRQNTL